MLIWSLFLQNLPTTTSSKLPHPRRQTNPLGYCVALATCLPSLAANPSTSHKVAGLVYCNLHDTSPTYLSSLLHAYTSTRPLRSSSAHLLVNLVSELPLLLVASDLPDHEFGTLSQMTSHLLHLSPLSDPNSKPTSLL